MPRYRLVFLAAFLATFVAGCDRATTVEEYGTRIVTLPDGTKLRCELMQTPTDMARGMMFRDSLAPDRGMLFLHDKPGTYAYWMYQTLIPLDIIWLDGEHRVLEIAANTPPCKDKSAKNCPSYGGRYPSQVVLEMNGGAAAKHGVVPGALVAF